MPSMDRLFLENRLFRVFRLEKYSVLSIGCHPASQIYRRLLPEDSYHTLDIDPGNARYGAASHTVGDCRELHTLFGGRRFDLILFNGIIGYGINDEGMLRAFLASAHSVLSDKGWLVIGYNDIPERKGELIHAIDPRLFRKTDFTDVIPSRVELKTHNRHTFEFYRRLAE
ncbi:MAG: class I SAM-dependent methyltransferase [Fibrobacteria bacterium]